MVKIIDHSPRNVAPPLTEQCCVPMIRDHYRSTPYMNKKKEQYKKKGWSVDHCFHHGRFEIDGKRYCASHAGAIALEILIEQNTEN